MKVVMVTGGSRGIGRAVALRFAEPGVALVLVHYDPTDEAAMETKATAEQRGAQVEVHKVDVSSFSSVQALFKHVIDRWKRVDVLVNNAGITRDRLLMRMSESDWDAVIAVNLKSIFNCTQAAVKEMVRQRSGRIVSISSVTGQMGNVGQANYAASKAGIMGFTKTVAREVASRGITVNAVAPGFIDTDMTAVLPEKVKEKFLEQIPLGRMGTPADVAEAVYWLCSDAAGYITGQVLHVNGGLYM